MAKFMKILDDHQPAAQGSNQGHMAQFCLSKNKNEEEQSQRSVVIAYIALASEVVQSHALVF